MSLQTPQELDGSSARTDCARLVVDASPVLRERESHHTCRHRLARAVMAVVLLTVLSLEGRLLAPDVSRSAHALARPVWGWVALAVLAEVSSMMTFARLQRRMLRAGGLKVDLRRVVALIFAANAMSVTLPAGPVVSSGYTFRRMRSWGASSSLVSWGLVASGVLSTIALTVIGLVGASLADGRGDVGVLVAEVVAAIAVGIGLRQLVRRPDLLLAMGGRLLVWSNRLRRRSLESGQERVREVVEELMLIRPGRRDWSFGLLFAAMNWLADMACLVAACHAIGVHHLTLGLALVAYAAGMAASSLPLLPGGIGVVEGALILALTHGGVPVALATAGVIVYRLISFGLVALLGWGTWLVIRRRDASAGSSPSLTDPDPLGQVVVLADVAAEPAAVSLLGEIAPDTALSG